MDFKSAVIVPRIFVIHIAFNVNFNAAHFVNDSRKSAGIDFNVAVNVYAEKIFDSLTRQFFTSVSISRVDFLITLPLNVNAGVTRN